MNFHPPDRKKAPTEIPSALRAGVPNNHSPEPTMAPVTSAFPGCILINFLLVWSYVDNYNHSVKALI